MPTKKKRVGFIPREDVMRIIDELSIENNLSNSKIVSILVEEALSIRGIFNKRNGKATQSYQLIEDHSQNLSDNYVDSIEDKEFTIDNKSRNHYFPSKTSSFKKTNQELFDLKTYKKFLSFIKFQEMMDKYDT